MAEMVADSTAKGSGSEDIIAQLLSSLFSFNRCDRWVGGFTERKRTEIVRLMRRPPGTNMFEVMYGMVLCPWEEADETLD